MRAYYVYILTNVNRKVMYIGVTNNLEIRMAEHRSGKGGAFTRRYRVHALVHAEEYQYVEDAIAREKEVKAWRRSKKDALVQATNPSWADLLETPVCIDPRFARDDTVYLTENVMTERAPGQPARNVLTASSRRKR